jgi:hypothetical protein
MGQEYNLPIVLPNQQVKLKGVPGQKPGILNFGGIDVDLASLPVDRELEIMPGLAKQGDDRDDASLLRGSVIRRMASRI